MALSFIPSTLEQALAWREAGGATGPVVAHQVSAEYLAAFDIDQADTRRPSRLSGVEERSDEHTDDKETAEFGMLYLASMSCLLQHPVRLALVVDSASCWTPVDSDDAEFGLGELAGFEWSEVTAFYIDEPIASADVSAAHEAVKNKTLTQAWEDDTVRSLLETHALLWHDVAELPWVEPH